MAKGTYISANLTAEQLRFLQLLDEQEILYFSLEDVEGRLGQKIANLNELVENLNHKGLLNRIERGKYARPPFRDPYVLGAFISKRGMVAYWSALHRHGLTGRFPNKVFIKTPSRKRDTLLFGTPVQFITVKPEKIVGITYQGYGDTRYPLTDVESTLLDCFDQPRYAGDWPDLLKAFAQADIDAEKLIRYAEAYGNQAVNKRMGYLAVLFHKKKLAPFIHFAQKNKGKRYALFNPGGPDRGAFNPRWMLRMNSAEADILQTAENSC